MPPARNSIRLAPAACLLLAGASAVADEGWSVATELGWNRYRIATPTGVENRDALASQVVLGYAPLSPRLEAGVVLLGARWRPGLMGAVVGEWRLGEHWSAFGRLGAYQRRTSRTGTLFNGTNNGMPLEGSNHVLAGVGVAWRLSPGWTDTRTLQGYELPLAGNESPLSSSTGANVLSVGLRHSFWHGFTFIQPGIAVSSWGPG
jgi:hypothetical protein